MDEQNHLSILERIHSAYYQLPAAERKVADYVLTNHSQVQFMSITQLADECGTAEATVSRFCRSLEVKGFNAFKLELARNHTNAPRQSHDPDTQDGRSKQAGAMAIQAIEQTLALVQPDKVLRTVELFENASRVMCIGSGGSMIIAEECANLFSTVTGKFIAVTDSHTQISAIATMSKQDAIVLFSYSGATTNSIQVLELAKQLEIPTVLVTRYSKSPAAKLADMVLLCGSNESPVQFGSVAAKVAQLMVIDVLFQEYCHRNRKTCEENIQRIASALAVKHL